MTAANVAATASVGAISIGCATSGCMVASTNVLGGLTLTESVAGTITGVKALANFSENLGYIHAITVNNPFSLSMEAQQLLWPGAAVPANQGWWLAMEDPIQLGNLSLTQPLTITNAVLNQLLPELSTYLGAHPPSCSVLACAFGTTLNVGSVNLGDTSTGGNGYFSNSSSSNYLNMPLSNQQLSVQGFTPNCRGSSKFC
jgi:hypothetical protein